MIWVAGFETVINPLIYIYLVDDIYTALSAYERVREIAEQSDDKPLEVRACANLGIVHHQVGAGSDVQRGVVDMCRACGRLRLPRIYLANHHIN